ncbi:MAG: hypothetical protein KJ950_14920 [Proteobacteria bacterium]|nr:hypothetical protein [Pseudomonadota bacterium]MBU1688627.1 hypothetical protein [Pseudomonadota bacterium]
MRRMKRSSLGIAITMLVALGGCGTDLDSNRAVSSQETAAPEGYAGVNQCIGCHQGFDWSADYVADFLESPHVLQGDEVTAADAADGCLECHDPIGDGRLLENIIDPADVPAEGMTAVTCENCHGAGSDHWLGGDIPTKEPDYTACGQCHDKNLDNNQFHQDNYKPVADNIVEDYSSGRHFYATLISSPVCSKCHTDQGARRYRDANTVEEIESEAAAVSRPAIIQCRTCHNPHNPKELLRDKTTTASTEYNTCTTCHQAMDAQLGTEVNYYAETDDGASGDVVYHAARWDRVMASTHYDNPDTVNVIEGVGVDPTSRRACRNCHNVHTADTTIHEQWAKSGHGGFLGEVKEEAAKSAEDNTLEQAIAVRAAGVTEEEAPPWVEYPWTTDERTDCVRCHTATGVAAFLDYLKAGNAAADFDPTAIPAPTTADPAAIKSLYDADGKFPTITMERTWDAGANWGQGGYTYTKLQKELLYCWGCHSDYTGTLRAPGAFTSDYGKGLAASTYPDANGSNVCIPCHSGRESGKSIAVLTTDYTNADPVSSHYLAAAGILYAESGYHFSGRDYTNSAVDANVGSHEHTTLGMGTTGEAEIDDEYEEGPCVTCHFDSKDGSHTLSPLTHYAANDLALNPVCVVCHDKRGEGTNAGPTWLGRPDAEDTYPAKTYHARYQASIKALAILLDTAGHPYLGNYPYFTKGDWTTIQVNSSAVTVSGEDTLGAAFNFNLLTGDPGGVIHNRQYVRRLLYDSIDFLDDGILNYSVLTTLNGLAETTDFTADEKADAINLLINKDDEIGTANERY